MTAMVGAHHFDRLCFLNCQWPVKLRRKSQLLQTLQARGEMTNTSLRGGEVVIWWPMAINMAWVKPVTITFSKLQSQGGKKFKY